MTELGGNITMTKEAFREEARRMIEFAVVDKDYSLEDLSPDMIAEDISGITGHHQMPEEGLAIIKEELSNFSTEINDDMKKPRAIIVVDGGIIQSIVVDSPIDITVIDYDTEGVSMSDLKKILGNDAIAFVPHVDESKDQVKLIYQDIKKAQLEAKAEEN